jgi:hypothetical protein
LLLPFLGFSVDFRKNVVDAIPILLRVSGQKKLDMEESCQGSVFGNNFLARPENLRRANCPFRMGWKVIRRWNESRQPDVSGVAGDS